jgi:hypothetical protein
MRDHDRSLLASARVREAIKAYGREVGYKALAELWCCDESTVALKIDERSRHYVKPNELLAVLFADLRGSVIAAVCDEAGYERPERKRVLEPAEKLERLTGALGELLGPELLALALKKAGIE